MKRRHHDWRGRELEVEQVGERTRVIRTDDGSPANEDRITFYDPQAGSVVSGTVRLSTGYFDATADGILYQITVDLDR